MNFINTIENNTRIFSSISIQLFGVCGVFMEGSQVDHSVQTEQY